MARLPIPGADAGTWGNVLNEYLGVSLAADGTLNSSVVGATQTNLPSVAGGMLLSGVLTSRPAPAGSNANLYYFATDVNGGTLYQSNGSSWTQVTSGVNHNARHSSGGADALSGNLDATARVNVSNNGTAVAARRGINLIPGSNISLSATDNSGSERVDVTISGTGIITGDDATLTFSETKYAAALITAANARIGTADVVVIGDSSVEGHGADSWYDRLPLAVGSQLGEAGYHLVLGSINSFGDNPTSFSGNAGTVAQDGTEGRGWACRNAVIRDGTGQITTTFKGDGFDLYYVAYSGGPTISIAVDGGTPSTVNMNEATTNRFKIWTGPTLTHGYHTVVITRSAGTTYAYVNSLRVYSGDSLKGVRVWDGGHAAYTTQAYLDQEAQWGPGITTIQPDLVILSIGGNDLVDGRTPAQAATSYKGIVDAIKARCTVAPQIIATLLSRHGSTTYENWAAMTAAFQSTAATEGWKWVDSTGILPQPSTYGSLYWTDNTHLTSAGQAVHAAALTSRLILTTVDTDYEIPNFARIVHGSNASAARPYALHVEWVGSVAPNNANTANDTWIDTA